MFLSKLGSWLRKVSLRWWTLLAECNLLSMGVALMGLDLAYFPEWLYNMHFGDFYTYLSLTGLISVWSIFGIMVTAANWYPGVKAYVIGLVILSTIQIACGVVHVVLLFTLYRQTLLDRCVNRGADALFWWSIQREDDPETQRLLSECNSKWARFALERVLTWAVYSASSVLSMFIIRKYYRHLYKAKHRMDDVQSGFVDDENHWPDEKPIVVTTHRQPSRKKKKKDKKRRNKHEEAAAATIDENAGQHYDHSPPPSYSEAQEQERIQNEMYKQRQKLYAEICKRREAAKKQQQRQAKESQTASSPQKSSAASSSSGVPAVHPLDLTAQDPENEYTPPSPPPAAVRMKDPFSSEKAEYDRYSSSGCEESLLVPSGAEDLERRESAMSRRRGKPSKRWSRLNPDEEKEMEPMLKEPEQAKVPRNE